MKPLPLIALLAFAVLLSSPAAAQEKNAESEQRQATKEEIQARLAEHAKRRAEEAQAVAEAEKKANEKPASDLAAPVAPARESEKAAAAEKKAKEESPTVLPKLEVQKERITELDRQIAEQNRIIAREKQNTKPTKLDETINSPKLSKVFAIFGGQSSEDRANIARERVAMMEDERDLIEAIAQARTPEEKAELQKTLDAVRAMRRDLEQALR